MTRTDPDRDSERVHNRLLALLQRSEAESRLRAELERARREFFGADRATYVDPSNAAAVDSAAHRFTEWFLIERPSDVLGITPLCVFGDPGGEDATLADSRSGLFLVESGGAEPQVRDLDGGESLTLRALPTPVQPGDVLVGRLYPLGDGVHVASEAAALMPGSPQIAVAFQRDRRRLDLGRRLTQAELERLVFQQWAAHSFAQAAAVGEDEIPIERLEADLQSLLEDADADDLFSATTLSTALRDAGDQGGQILGPLLDQLAFETEVDLDRARELLVALWNQISKRGSAPPAAPEPPASRAAKPRRFDEQSGEHLGQRLARRIEEGLAGGEDVAAMFEDVERILGEPIEPDGEGDEEFEALDDGDLEPLLREFAWETGLTAPQEAMLGALAAAQRAAPVPRLHVEYLDTDDWFRWLLQIWLGAAPAERERDTRSAFAVAGRFQDWLVAEQAIDVRARLEPARRILIDEIGRLQLANDALSQLAAESVPAPVPPRLLRVVGHRVVGPQEAVLRLESTADGAVHPCRADARAVAHLEDGDLVFAGLIRRDDRAILVGPIAIVPAGAEPLLG